MDDLSSASQDFIDDSDEHHDDISSEIPDTPNLVKRSRADAGFLIFMLFVVVGYEGIVVALRFLNIDIVNKNIVPFLIVVSDQ